MLKLVPTQRKNQKVTSNVEKTNQLNENTIFTEE